MSSNKLTLEQFIDRARNSHGDKYDYSLVEYVNVDTKVIIKCPEHGEFKITPYEHMKGRGCPDRSHRVSLEDIEKRKKHFLMKAKEIHGDRYDYSLVEYINGTTKVKIICSIHGIFEQIPNSHLRKAGCPHCAGNVNSNTEVFIERSRKIHGDVYDYSLVEYVNTHTHVRIICSKHGVFEQVPKSHLKGIGCTACAGKPNINSEIFIQRAKEIHGDRYDYSLVEYKNATSKVKIICPEHGEFEQYAYNHINALHPRGCWLCGGSYPLNTKEFIEKSKTVHDDKYDYSKSQYLNSASKVTIICPEHGEYKQRPDKHWLGQNCPKCALIEPKPELELVEFLDGLNVIRNTRMVIPPKELDLYLPEHSLAIEYCGVYWHSEKFGKGKYYHRDKTYACYEKHIQLLTIFEDEWIHTPHIVKNIINHRIGRAEKGVGARKLAVRFADSKETNDFLNRYHLQGDKPGKNVNVGAYHGNELVAVMTFSSDRNNQYTELSRFATNNKTYAGVASRLLMYYIKEYDPVEIVSFADLRWSNGNLYETIGFSLDKIIDPDYSYVVNGRKIHKSNFRKSNIKKKFDVNIEGKTERQLMEELNIPRIWDCGKARYVWRKKGV